MKTTTGREVRYGGAERERRYRERGWWPGVPLAERFRRFVEARPGALTVVDDRGGRLDREQLWEEAGRLGADLAEQGIGPGDVVFIFLPNQVESQVAMLAALRRGAVPASLPIRSDEATLRYAAELCGARAILTVERHGRTGTGELAVAAAGNCPAPPAVVVAGDDGTRRWPRPGPGPGRDGKVRGRDTAPAHPAEGLDHLMFTSSRPGPLR